MENRARSKAWLRRALVISLLLIIAFVIAAILALPSFERKLKEEMVQSLKNRFQSEAEIQSLELSLFPYLHAQGRGLKLWYRGMKDIPPMISIESFSLSSKVPYIFGEVKKIGHVQINGLMIQIPPKSKKEGVVAPKPQPPKSAEVQSVKKRERKIPRFLIEEINADGTMVKILPSKPDKDPMVFELHKLKLESVGMDRPMLFQALLKNPKPPGLVQTRGQFGPWNAPNPGGTPVSGKYTFRNADLSVFKGIRGILSSDGQYSGVLERLDVKGTTDTPDFALQRTGNAVPLKTNFHSIVDGTSGDTLLKPVIALLGKTQIVCDGGVIGQKRVKGKSVLLDVRINHGRIQDVLTLAVSAKPLMTGFIDFQGKFNLPPGDVDVIQKLDLEGTFQIGRAVFRSFTIQQKILELSQKALGKPEEAEADRVASNMKGRFVLRNATIRFTDLTFSVPGAVVALSGTYGIRNEVIDFKGELRMQATISQTQKGIKSFLLKVLDPFFKKKGYGSVLPIKITGTRSNPKFGLNL